VALALLGAPVGLAAALLLGRVLAPDEPTTPPERVEGVAEVGGALREVWLQYTEAGETLVDEAYADFLGGLAQDVELRVLVGMEADAAAWRRFARNLGLGGAARAKVTVAGTPITVWSRDRALALRGSDARWSWLVPPEPDESWELRRNDWRAVFALARARGGTDVVELPFEFEAGDLIVTESRVLFGANLAARNAGGPWRETAALREALRAWTGREPLQLGAEEGDVPPYHLAMYVMPVAADVALVGDPSIAKGLLGEAWRSGALRPEDDAPLVADFGSQMQARFDRAASDLTAAGWRVYRVPVVPFDDRTYITWTNVVLDRRDGRGVVYLPSYAADAAVEPQLARLDARSRAAWEQHGYDVRPIRVRKLWPHHGTIGCLINVLARSPARP